MPKNPANRAKQARKDAPLNGAMKLFLAGCVAELYLLLIRRFYINGTIYQVVAWDDALKALVPVGAAVAAVGLVLALVFLKKAGWQRTAGWWVFGAGAFLGGASWVARTVYATGVTMLCVVVPVVMLLGILWFLYDRECFYALTLLGVSSLVVWICRHGVGNANWNTPVKIGAAVYLAVLVLLALSARKAEQKDGMLGKLRVLPPKADVLPVYTACGLSGAAVLAALFSATVAYYSMWALAVVIFALAVYYTVKQL